MQRLTLAVAYSTLLTGCFIVPEDATPSLAAELGVADKYIHRGMPQNRNWVAQGSAEVGLPSKWGEEDSINLRVWGNMDLRDNTGSAWFPSGHDGRLSQIDVIGSYTHVIGDFDVTLGVHDYNLPFGSEFPFGVRSSTNALFFRAGTEVLGARPQIDVFWDFDQADGVYVRFSLSESFQIVEKLSLTLHGFVGYTTDDQAQWDYGISENGFADIQGTATLTYQFDDHTAFSAHIDGSNVIDSDIRDWFDVIDVPKSNLWGGVFVEWTY